MTGAEAREWFEAAVELDAENRQLRQWMTNILLVVATRDELLELGRAEIEQRWPAEGASVSSLDAHRYQRADPRWPAEEHRR